MGSFGNFWENEISNHVFIKGSCTPRTNIFVAPRKSTADTTVISYDGSVSKKWH